MKAELKNLSSDNFDVNEHQPPDKECFTIRLVAMIGVESQASSDLFYFHVCTPRWLTAHMAEPTWGHQMLIVNHYNFAQIKRAVEVYCDKCVGNNWEEIALKLSRVTHWEFSDYKTNL